MGGVTLEQHLYSTATGALLTTDPGLYKLPLATDTPKRLSVSLLKHDEDEKDIPTSAVYRSKGIGEPNLIVGAAGTLLAVRNAVAAFNNGDDWVQIDAPATADKIRMACKDGVLDGIKKENEGIGNREKVAFEF